MQELYSSSFFADRKRHEPKRNPNLYALESPTASFVRALCYDGLVIVRP